MRWVKGAGRELTSSSTESGGMAVIKFSTAPSIVSRLARSAMTETSRVRRRRRQRV